MKFYFTREDALMDKMIVHLNVLSSGVENRVLRELDVAEVVAVAASTYGFACHDNCSSILGFGARQCNCQLLLTAPRVRGTPERERVSGRGSAIGGIASPICIGVAD